MRTNFIVLTLLILSSCGKNVATPGNLESVSNITSGNTQNLTSTGKLFKDKTSGVAKITIGSKSYTVSRFSSYLAYTYIDGKSFGTEYTVKFKGQIKEPEIILENIQDTN